jgi:hypothetical protein
MPVARLPSDPVAPARVTEEEAAFIKATIQRFYGPAGIIRNYGPLPSRLDLHVEADQSPGTERWECLGILFTRIDRDQITLEVTKRLSRGHGRPKLAYRQGVIL